MADSEGFGQELVRVQEAASLGLSPDVAYVDAAGALVTELPRSRTTSPGSRA